MCTCPLPLQLQQILSYVGRPRGTQGASRHSRVNLLSFALWLLPLGCVFFLLGFASMPHCIWAAPPEVLQFCSYYAHVAIPAVDRCEPPEAHLYPDEISSSKATSERPEGDSVELPTNAETVPTYSERAWLGVTVFAPYCQTVAFGLRVDKTAQFMASCHTHLRQDALS